MKSIPRLYYALLLAVVVIAIIFYGCQGVKQSSSNDPGNSPSPTGPTPSGSPGSPASPGAAAGQINHIIVLLQENRSFDSYFGRLSAYWAANGYPPQPFDGIPLSASNPGCDPSGSGNCIVDAASPVVPVFHLGSVCMELTFPGWSQSHEDFNRVDPANGPPALDGFVEGAANLARDQPNLFHDKAGRRAMGYYDGTDLNYYYFMASNFATSDRWFSPVMARTEPNRMYLQAATSHGHVQELGATSTPPLSDKTIFELLQENGISWKIYVNADGGCLTASCLIGSSYISMFTFGNTLLQNYPQNMENIFFYFHDVANGTLPQVAFIEPASNIGLDEHPSVGAPVNIQSGEAYVASIINSLMTSVSWKDSVFILSFDEAGGIYDHVPPQPAVSPDGIPPSDLPAGDACVKGGANCNFTMTGFRVPFMVISPYARKNYVSHTVADHTAILKFIEQRFNLPNLTARDAAQMDMSEFFDMTNPPWMTPPTPPAQNKSGACYLDHLP